MNSLILQLSSGITEFWAGMIDMQLQHETVSPDFVIIQFFGLRPCGSNYNDVIQVKMTSQSQSYYFNNTINEQMKDLKLPRKI